MKVLLINGSPRQHGCTEVALQEVAATLGKEGIDTEILWLGTAPMQDCIACNHCRQVVDGKPRLKCVFDDDLVNETAQKVKESDGIIVGSPVYYSGATARVTAFLDRLYYSTSKPEAFFGKPAAAVVSCRRGGGTASFERLNQYFLITNMLVVGSQYWNQIHGNTPDEARQDLEGLQTMRTLGQNMAYILKAKALAAEAGLQPPVYETPIVTNFIH